MSDLLCAAADHLHLPVDVVLCGLAVGVVDHIVGLVQYNAGPRIAFSADHKLFEDKHHLSWPRSQRLGKKIIISLIFLPLQTQQ